MDRHHSANPTARNPPRVASEQRMNQMSTPTLLHSHPRPPAHHTVRHHSDQHRGTSAAQSANCSNPPLQHRHSKPVENHVHNVYAANCQVGPGAVQQVYYQNGSLGSFETGPTRQMSYHNAEHHDPGPASALQDRHRTRGPAAPQSAARHQNSTLSTAQPSPTTLHASPLPSQPTLRPDLPNPGQPIQIPGDQRVARRDTIDFLRLYFTDSWVVIQSYIEHGFGDETPFNLNFERQRFEESGKRGWSGRPYDSPDVVHHLSACGIYYIGHYLKHGANFELLVAHLAGLRFRTLLSWDEVALVMNSMNLVGPTQIHPREYYALLQLLLHNRHPVAETVSRSIQNGTYQDSSLDYMRGFFHSHGVRITTIPLRGACVLPHAKTRPAIHTTAALATGTHSQGADPSTFTPAAVPEILHAVPSTPALAAGMNHAAPPVPTTSPLPTTSPIPAPPLLYPRTPPMDHPAAGMDGQCFSSAGPVPADPVPMSRIPSWASNESNETTTSSRDTPPTTVSPTPQDWIDATNPSPIIDLTQDGTLLATSRPPPTPPLNASATKKTWPAETMRSLEPAPTPAPRKRCRLDEDGLPKFPKRRTPEPKGPPPPPPETDRQRAERREGFWHILESFAWMKDIAGYYSDWHWFKKFATLEVKLAKQVLQQMAEGKRIEASDIRSLENFDVKLREIETIQLNLAAQYRKPVESMKWYQAIDTWHRNHRCGYLPTVEGAPPRGFGARPSAAEESIARQARLCNERLALELSGKRRTGGPREWLKTMQQEAEEQRRKAEDEKTEERKKRAEEMKKRADERRQGRSKRAEEQKEKREQELKDAEADRIMTELLMAELEGHVAPAERRGEDAPEEEEEWSLGLFGSDSPGKEVTIEWDPLPLGRQAVEEEEEVEEEMAMETVEPEEAWERKDRVVPPESQDPSKNYDEDGREVSEEP